MPDFDPRMLARATGGSWRTAPAASVTGFCIDSRTVAPGELFVALSTSRRDGHEFVAHAAAHGAAGALVSRFLPGVDLPQLVVPDTCVALQALARAHRAEFSGPIVAVTGSAGKTSTKDLLFRLLGEPGEVLATEGNLNNHLGVPLTLLRLDADRHRRAVIEAGVGASGEMELLASLIAPDVAVVTTIGAAHLDGLGSIEGVAAEKARLAAHLRPGGVAVYPASCRRFAAFRALDARAIVALPRGEGSGDLPATSLAVPYEVFDQGETSRLRLTWAGAVEEYDLRRTTGGMASNAVLAIAASRHLGVTPEQIRSRLPRWQPAALRGEIRRERGQWIYLDCYNANPASMMDAVESFVGRVPPDLPRLFVLGTMEELGGEAAALHRATGEGWPVREGDVLIVFGPQAGALAEGVTAALGPARARILIDPDRVMAARLVREFRGAVFLKGSRRYELEKLLEANEPGQAGREELAA